MLRLVGLCLVATLGCGQSSSDSERSGGGGSASGGESGDASTGGGTGGMGATGGSGLTGGASGEGGSAGDGSGTGGAAGAGGGPGCISPPWPGEECENGVWFCRPDARDFMLCDPTLCATCEGFDSPEEQNGCRCMCNDMRTGVTCERT